jgi:cytochrome c oxidase subunit 1
MASINAPIESHDHHDEGSYLEAKHGIVGTIWDWMTTVDHKKIGVMYLFAVLAAFFLGGVMALGVRAELLEPAKTITNAAGEPQVTGQMFETMTAYNRVFTIHGAVMVFLFIIPSIPAALGNFLLPLMLGAKDVAFPKLNLTSWYVYLFGTVLALFSLIMKGPDTGWTFYTPYSIRGDQEFWNVILMTLAVFVLGFSSIFTGMNFVVTVHKLRAPGMGWFDMPLFVWGIYGTSIIQVLATPVLGITVLLLTLERVFKIGIFDPALGGDPVLYQHFFWFYSHPAVYIMILPGFAIISELIAVHSRKAIFGYKFVAFSSLAIAAVSFIVWGHHMFTSQGALAGAIFSALTFLVAIPSAVKVFNWTATLYKGSIALTTPMVYALIFLFTFTIGGLTGLFLGTLATDIHLHDTYFVVAHFHYVMMGGTVMAFLGGMHHWWPKMFGKMYSERWALVSAALVFIGFNMTFFVQFILGSEGMPRRYATYADQFTLMHQISTYGSWILALGLFAHLFVFLHSLVAGRKAPANPWGGMTMEWEADSPPIEHNFHHEPVCRHGPYAFDDFTPPNCEPGEFPLPADKPADDKH